MASTSTGPSGRPVGTAKSSAAAGAMRNGPVSSPSRLGGSRSMAISPSRATTCPPAITIDTRKSSRSSAKQMSA